jgi:protein-L-isoaspartate(D-aspartate) O-methyltransferase
MSFDFALARENMVENDVRTNDVTDRRLIAAMRAIPREKFAPQGHRELAYGGLAVPVAGGRFLLDPRTFSKLVQAAEIAPSDHVLDIGCATGYSAAVLARIAGSVVAVEEDEGLARLAIANLAELGATVTVVEGKLSAGAAGHAPYDVILLEGMVAVLPASLADQLKEGGRLLAVEAAGSHLGRAMLYVRAGGATSGRALFDASAPRLPGFERQKSFVF